MFRIESYKVCEVTGVTDFEIQFNIGTGIKEDKRSYFVKEDADRYIAEMKRDYILTMFSNYVNHARILSEVGARSFYVTPERSAALEKCIKANRYFQNQLLKDICYYIIKLEVDLRMILPSPGNNSYQSSEDRLLDMIVFSKSVYTIPVDKKQPVEID